MGVGAGRPIEPSRRLAETRGLDVVDVVSDGVRYRLVGRQPATLGAEYEAVAVLDIDGLLAERAGVAANLAAAGFADPPRLHLVMHFDE